MSNQVKYCIRVAMVAAMVIAMAIFYLPRGSAAQTSAAQTSAAQSGTAMNGYQVAPDFLAYWNAHGGLAINGYPITGEAIEVSATDGKSYATQWFERARYERHPENPAATSILLGLLGSEYTQGRSFALASSTVSSASVAYFAETGHSLANSPAPFKDYWQQHGGLAQFGYPLSEQIQEASTDGHTYTVQYFERQRFEFHPEQSNPQYHVLLGLLGVQLHDQPGSDHHCDAATSSAPQPEPTGTVEVTHEPHPTCTPEPTETHHPEPTHTPGCDGDECHTPMPTPIGTTTHEPEPTQTPDCGFHCPTPEPTRTPDCGFHCQTPEPTSTPTATHEPEPTRTPDCGYHCQPTATPQP